MLSLSEAQGNLIETINNGPDRLDPMLFAGPQSRILLGLKAHANTISHARLVALEETFPLTREHIGGVAFNQLSREYVDGAQARTLDSSRIGQYFSAFLRSFPVNAAASQLAAIEWAWLESYHAADAVALGMADLGKLQEDALLATGVAPHPSARITLITAPLAPALDELAAPHPHAVLTVRPDADVRLVALDASQAALLARAAIENCTIGNLLELAFEVAGEQAPLEPILHLIGAGALVKTG
jgi:hypothetical protein